MPPAPIPENERERIAALRRYDVLDTPAEESFDRFTRFASSILDTPTAVLSLIAESEQWFKSTVGLDVRSTPRSHSFGAYTILGDEVLVVPDATCDARFADSPLVVDTGIRFYAGAPLTTPDGYRIGTLSVVDDTARPEGLTPLQQQQLRDLAALVVDQLELRRRTAELEASRVALQREGEERLAQLDALGRSEQRYRLLFRANPQPMWVYALETFAFLDVNDAAEALYGYTHDEFLAMTVMDIRPPEEVEHVRRAAADLTDTLARSGPWRHLRRDGSTVFVRISSYPTVFEGQQARLVLATDITAEKELEEQLVQAQKMEAVGQLAGGVAHDFNNLLTVINGYGQLVMSRLHEADPLRVDTGNILQAGERAATLTQQLLAFSRRQMLQPRPLDVSVAITTVRPMLARLLREDIELSTSMPAALPPVMVDPVQFEQVLLNLAINGADAMPDGGTMSIDAQETWLDGEVAERHEVAPGPFVAVSVSDTGIGMDEATRGRVFEPFFTTKAKGRGSGLGLPVAYGIVKQSGGTIAVHTAPGEGSTFTVYLPLAPPDSRVTDEEPQEARSPITGHETVLIVEDHEAVRRLAADVLRAYGYEVITAEHGAEAIALVDARGGSVDLLLTDVIMPRMSGRDVAMALQQRVPDLAVLYMSGYTQMSVEQEGAIESGLEFLPKPFTPTDLLGRVRDVLGARPQTAAPSRPASTSASSTPPPDPPAGNAADGDPADATVRPRRIVVADDEPGLRMLLKTTLTRKGYDVLLASNGLEAVRLCENESADLLITDLVMPDHEGLETIRRMRTACPSIPVVAMSGAFDGGFLDVARAMGAAAVIQKPFTPADVVAVVAKVLGQA